jgi:biotin carboxyl carrier protein
MNEQIRISGKRLELPRGKGSHWKITSRPGGWLVAERALPDGSLERRRFSVLQSQATLSAQISGNGWFGQLSQTSRGAAAGGGSDSDLVAQFPGKVRKLLVSAGDRVSEGDPLLMVEAMKMEFPVKAPYAGRVSKVHVTEGQQLAPGQRFLDLEKSGGL